MKFYLKDRSANVNKSFKVDRNSNGLVGDCHSVDLLMFETPDSCAVGSEEM
jgi:hypothetical protein